MEVIAPIKQGGFGLVEQVRDSDGTIFARKTFNLSSELGYLSPEDTERVRKRFEREVKIQASLDSPSFMPISRHELNESPPWFLMPLADMNYAEKIEDDRDQGIVSAEPILDILNALEELHLLGFAHRDLKPENVLLHEGTWKLADFGLVAEARAVKTTRLTSTGSVWGTQAYMAPEQFRSLKSATPLSDIYSFGCILHDLLVGELRVPFQRHSAGGLFGAIIEKCTEIDPRRRFKNVRGLRAAVVDALREASAPETSDESVEWQKLLEEVPILEWSESQLAGLIATLEAEAEGENAASWLFATLTDEHLDALAEHPDAEWDRIVLAYCDWAHASFGFEFCDVLIGRLESIFRHANSSVAARAAALTAAAKLGAGHNRWFVMRKVLKMAGKGLDDEVAQRVVIEIRANEQADDFRTCASNIHRPLSAYHPRLAEVLA